MNVKTHNWKCRGCGSRISVTYTTQTVVIGWSSEEVWPDTSYFSCPICKISLKPSTESLSKEKSKEKESGMSKPAEVNKSRPPGW